MEQAAAEFSERNIRQATGRSKRRVDQILALAKTISEDCKRGERLIAQKCLFCYYESPIAGRAITHRPCMCCGERQTYPSTSTGVLCQPCAKKLDLCCHCGGDIEMRLDRKVEAAP